MTLYKVGHEREQNGYSDSDWFCMVYDDEAKELKSVMVGTTRGGDGSFYNGIVVDTPEHVFEEAKLAFTDRMAKLIVSIDANQRKKEAERVGCRVTLTEAVHNNRRRTVQGDCKRCTDGYWVNPKNPADRRSCFTCNGTGIANVSMTGKGSMDSVKIEAGSEGIVTQVDERRSQYGSWSYGKTVTVRRDDGTTFRAAPEKLCGVREIISEDKARRAAETLAEMRDFDALNDYVWRLL